MRATLLRDLARHAGHCQRESRTRLDDSDRAAIPFMQLTRSFGKFAPTRLDELSMKFDGTRHPLHARNFDIAVHKRAQHIDIHSISASYTVLALCTSHTVPHCHFINRNQNAPATGATNGGGVS
jgi:hypothetical protein